MKGRRDETQMLPQVVSRAIEMLIMHALRDGQEVTSAAVSKSIVLFEDVAALVWFDIACME